jgi:dienelactone hydrolase
MPTGPSGGARRSVRTSALAGIATLALAGLALVAPAAVPSAAAGVPGLPDNVPPAAQHPEPGLDPVDGWAFSNAFPRTSGSGRMVGGAQLWSDWLYDDHGASGTPVYSNDSVSSGGSPAGTYAYPDGPAARNGADIARVGIAIDGASSVWRVDWNTLVDPNVPIAEFTFDTDASAKTGWSAWPGGAGITSGGIDKALIVSARGAWLVDVARGTRTTLAPPKVDRAAGAFVARVPRALLTPSGVWTVRLASGVADAAGSGFQPVSTDMGAAAGQPAVYNVAFRTSAQEPLSASIWADGAQAAALTAGDVSAFAASIRWAALASHASTPEPFLTGASNRWYVSSRSFGAGVVANDTASNPAGVGTQDLRPNFLGRVQPYAVYVPRTYNSARRAPLTFLLHSLLNQHNEYVSKYPELVQQVCENRGSICVTPLGRGPDGWYLDEAELDFWEVWRSVAASYRVDAERTTVYGFSMGGSGVYRMVTAHPDLFAKVAVNAGPPTCGIDYGVVQNHGTLSSHCVQANYLPLLENTREVPFLILQGAPDGNVPATGAANAQTRLDALGYRYRLELHLAKSHQVMAESHVGAFLAASRRRRAPARVVYSWYPDLDRPEWGLTTTGVYWVRGLATRTVAAGTRARVAAASQAIAEPTITSELTASVDSSDPTDPATILQRTWRAAPSTRPTTPNVSLALTNVRAVTVDLAGAGLRNGVGRLSITTDGPTAVTVPAAAQRRSVTVDGRALAAIAAGKCNSISIPNGAHDVVLGTAGAAATGDGSLSSADGHLPATGGGAGAAALALVLIAAGLAVRSATRWLRAAPREV